MASARYKFLVAIARPRVFVHERGGARRRLALGPLEQRRIFGDAIVAPGMRQEGTALTETRVQGPLVQARVLVGREVALRRSVECPRSPRRR